MPLSLRLALLALCALGALAQPAGAASRVKDIADFEGIRENMLVGYGLVVGLNGTGDSLNRSIFTRESLIGMLERLGVNARDTSLRTQNVAAVMTTTRIDQMISVCYSLDEARVLVRASPPALT